MNIDVVAKEAKCSLSAVYELAWSMSISPSDGTVTDEQGVEMIKKLLARAAKERSMKLSEEWQQLMLDKDSRGNPKKTTANVMTIMRHDPEVAKVFSRNQFTGEICVVAPPPTPTSFPLSPIDGYPRPMTDQDVTRIRAWLECPPYMITMHRSTVIECIECVASENGFHPVRDYLMGLQWDGITRIDDWLTNYCAAEYTRYTQRVGRYWLLSAVARIMSPGCQVDHVLVLEGKQGAGKSSAMRLLAHDPAWFYDGPIDLYSKESAMLIRGKWIVEFAELGGMRRADTERIKEFFTSHTDKFILKYKNFETQHPRQCVFSSTVNMKQYLNDPTGNRRMWPVRIGERIFLGKLEADIDQLWAEAVMIYRSHILCPLCAKGISSECEDHRWWPSEDEQYGLFSPEQSSRVHDDVWASAINRYMSANSSDKDFRSSSEVLTGALSFSINEITEREQNRLARIMTMIGFEPKPFNENGAVVTRWVPDAKRKSINALASFKGKSMV